MEILSHLWYFIRVKAMWINYNGQPHWALFLLKEFRHCQVCITRSHENHSSKPFIKMYCFPGQRVNNKSQLTNSYLPFAIFSGAVLQSCLWQNCYQLPKNNISKGWICASFPLLKRFINDLAPVGTSYSPLAKSKLQ